jgi:hypothetical protein
MLGTAWVGAAACNSINWDGAVKPRKNSMRVFANLLSLALLVTLAVTQSEAQEQRKLPRIGVLMSGSESSSRLILDGLRKGLADVGIAEGTGVVLDTLWRLSSSSPVLTFYLPAAIKGRLP